MKKIILLFVVLLLSNSLRSQELKLCGVEWPPFTITKNGKIVGGISFDIYTEAFERLNMKFVADDIPYPRCLMYVKTGRYDAVIDYTSVEPYVTGRFPTGIYPLAVYVRKEFPQDEFSWKLLEGKVVGYVRGYYYSESITNFDGWIKDLAVTDEMMLMKLKGNRYDYVILDIFTADILSKKIGVDIKMLKPVIDATNLFLSFNASKADYMEKYDEIIGEMIKDGTMDRIYLKYMPHSYTDILGMYLTK